MGNIVYLFSSFLSSVIVIGLLVQFLNDRYEKTYENVLIYRIVPSVAVIVVTMVNQLRSPVRNIIANILAFVAISFFLYRDTDGRKYWRVMESACLFVVIALFEGIGVLAIGLLIDAIRHAPQNEIVRESIEFVFSNIVLLFLYYMVLRRFWKKDLRQNKSQFVLCLIMFLYSTVNMLAIESIVAFKEHYVITCVNIGYIVFANLYLFYYMRMTDEKNELDLQVVMMKQQESLQFEYYEIQRERYRQSIAILHDVSKHIRSIEELYKAGEDDQALQYTKEIDNILKPLIPADYSNNPMLNILLSDKKQLAESQGIRFRIKIEKAGLDFMAPMDVTTLLGNLLENAIEACERCQGKKDISISIRNYNDMLSIRIENTVEWEVKFQNSRPVRESGDRGGIGTLNVERCVEKYGGSVLYRNENGKFCCDILLNK